MTLRERCTNIELLLLDVDGVLSEGSIIYSSDGTEIKRFHVRDGSGLVRWKRCGKQVAILSGRTSGATKVRAAELGIAEVMEGAADKLDSFRHIVQHLQLRPDQVCAVGDDALDAPVLRECGLAVAVADAAPVLFRYAHYVTLAAGGRGAVREVIELILSCHGHQC